MFDDLFYVIIVYRKDTKMYDENLLIELIRHSIVLNEKQKSYLIENLSFLKEVKKRKLFDIFAKEQKERRKINQKRIQLSKEHAHDVQVVHNKYKEKLGRYNESKVLQNLDEEMESVFDVYSPDQ